MVIGFLFALSLLVTMAASVHLQDSLILLY